MYDIYIYIIYGTHCKCYTPSTQNYSVSMCVCVCLSISCGRYNTAAKAFEFGVRYQSTMAWVTCKIYAYVYLYIYI